MRKKKFLLQTDFALAKTGFARCAKALLSYLFRTGKYEILHVCCGMPENAPLLEQTPWKSIGLIPIDPANQQRMQQDPNFGRMASYGAALIDKHVQEFKPDVFCASQDFWGVDFNIEKSWFNKISSIIWTTLDSRPLLHSAVEKSSKIRNFWMWADFATKDMHKLGFNHVKTVHGPVESEKFFPLSEKLKKELRKKYNIPENAFIINFTFRNQLRKLVDKLIEGYGLWKKRNPEIKNTFLLLMTHFGEGWNIDALVKQSGVNPKDILTVYVCRNCGEYEIKSYDERSSIYELDEKGAPKITSEGKFIEKPLNIQDKDCKFCNAQKSQITTNVGLGITEEQLNEVYNISDIYIHCMTSGGQEIPLMESALCGLPGAVTNYSCGEDVCQPYGPYLPLDYSTYLEIGTQFIKASTNPSSVAKQIDRLYRMGSAKRREIGIKAREWAIQNYDISVIGKIFEDFIDNAPFVDENNPANFVVGEEKQWNPNAQLPVVNSDEEFVIQCYHQILSSPDVAPGHPDLANWANQLKNGSTTRAQVEGTFRNIAAQELQKNQKIGIENLLDDNGKKKFLIVLKDSAGDILNASSLLESWRENHPAKDWDLYFSCDPIYFSLLEGNPYIYKLLPFQPAFQNELICTGQGSNRGWFDGYCNLGVGSQMVLNYLTNNNLGLELNK